jgi:hypothetical protein
MIHDSNNLNERVIISKCAIHQERSNDNEKDDNHEYI